MATEEDSRRTREAGRVQLWRRAIGSAEKVSEMVMTRTEKDFAEMMVRMSSRVRKSNHTPPWIDWAYEVEAILRKRNPALDHREWMTAAGAFKTRGE